MPIYEYQCLSCQTGHEQLRTIGQADQPVTCPQCGSQQSRRLLPSTFAAHSGGHLIAAGSGGCGSCSSAKSACRSCRGA